MELHENQAALVLTIDEAGEVSVDVAAQDSTSLPAEVCKAIAMKLIGDENFQEEIMGSIE